jgi:outer membrane receptor protein involved in Fe transport
MDRLARRLLGSSAIAMALAYGVTGSAQATGTTLDLPSQPLDVALNTVGLATGSEVLFSKDQVSGRRSPPLKGVYEPREALVALLTGTNLAVQSPVDNVFVVAPERSKPLMRVAANTSRPAGPAAVETITVTAQRVREDIQNVPIAVSAFSQKQLTERQIATGGDLIRETPNMNFGKTNFSGYSIELRGIGTQAISVTTDPAVAVAFNGTPFIRNHFFEQEFYDVESVEVLRGPQGTLWGRNATAGVVNIISAKPTDTYEAMASVDIGNFLNRRLEGMINIPIVGDKLDIRAAGEWTMRSGYSTNSLTNSPIDGRDLWSGRVSISFKPSADLQADLVWEHFSEDDDRLRSGKQLCKTDYGPGGTPTNGLVNIDGTIKGIGPGFFYTGDYMTQGCAPVSLYSPEAFQAPLGFTLPYILGLQDEGNANLINPYASQSQSHDLRTISSGVAPKYRAKNDTVELNVDYNMSPTLTLTAQTGFNQDFLWSTEDYNRFGAAPGLFLYQGDGVHPDAHGVLPGGVFCDPQLGCSDRLILQDLSTEHAWQLSQEFRLASNFSGPFNFSLGANYLHYETLEDYYVFGNVLTLLTGGFTPGVHNSNGITQLGQGFQYNNGGPILPSGGYIDPNPLTSLNNNGHNYFLSQNPYTLNSYAMFGEVNYKITDDLKLTGGLRWTDDQKHFVIVPSWLVESGYGYPVGGKVDQQWGQVTGRAVVNWTPKLDFTDQTLIYASYGHGYKAGGANPPGASFSSQAFVGSNIETVNPTHPLTFKPEFIDAFELGTKNTLFDGSLTLNADIFYYAYKAYQISEIVDRTAINSNYDATVKGAELETTWEPTPGLKFSFAGGYENSRLNNGDTGVDLMDRTAGTPGWVVVKPFVNEASNCIFPASVARYFLDGSPVVGGTVTSYCAEAYLLHNDPLTGLPYVPNPTVGNCNNGYGCVVGAPAGYPGFDPSTAPNNGTGFSKNLGGNQLPNAPEFTLSFTADYTMPVADDWAATLHGDFYWQANSMARVFNDRPYDQLHGYTNLNLSLILNSADGWQVMGYVKNVLDTTAITGDFLNSDDSGLTTNIFLTDPRLYGVRITKHLDENDGFWGSEYSGSDIIKDLFADSDGGKPELWIDLGTQLERLRGAPETFAPSFFAAPQPGFVAASPALLAPMVSAQKPNSFSVAEDASITFAPSDSDWQFVASIHYGRSGDVKHKHYQTRHTPPLETFLYYKIPPLEFDKFGDGQVAAKETHFVIDFQAGRDVGLGMFGATGSSVFSAGVRFAQFTSNTDATLHARPSYAPGQYFVSQYIKFNGHKFQTNEADLLAKRSTHAIGPSLSWNGSMPFAGTAADGEFTVDWGLNGAVLFGRQHARVHHKTTGGKYSSFNPPSKTNRISGYTKVIDHNRSKLVTIPNVGGFAGISMKWPNAKVSFGYRADFFLGALDGGIDSRKSETLGYMGPFAKISIGIGG